MIKRSAAIVGVVLALGATAAVAIAIWPERAGEGGSTSTGQPPVGSAAGRAGGLDGGTQAGIPSVTAPDIGTAPLTVDARFALRPLAGPSPVRYRFKHPPLAGVLFDVRTGQGDHYPRDGGDPLNHREDCGGRDQARGDHHHDQQRDHVERDGADVAVGPGMRPGVDDDVQRRRRPAEDQTDDGRASGSNLAQ